MSFSNVGQVWTPETLRQYLATLARPPWVKAICLHHTAAPSLAQRPNGLLAQHIVNIRDFYRDDKGWSAGPHFFTDEDQIYGMTPPTERGVHAVSFNGSAIGIEVLGDYDSEDPLDGRGLQCWQTTARAVAALLDWLSLPLDNDTIWFHRNDPSTSKSCPGEKVSKAWVMELIRTSNTPAAHAEDPKPALPAGKTWDRWERRANFWAVPVADFLNTMLGIPYEVIAANLKKSDDGYHYGDELLEGAWFNVPNAETWGSAKELLGLG